MGIWSTARHGLSLLAGPQAVHAEALPGACRGFLHADGYTGFGKLYQPSWPGNDAALLEVACWSHVRRKFYDVHHAVASATAL